MGKETQLKTNTKTFIVKSCTFKVQIKLIGPNCIQTTKIVQVGLIGPICTQNVYSSVVSDSKSEFTLSNRNEFKIGVKTRFCVKTWNFTF